MPSPKPYRNIPVADLPDTDWVADQAVPDDVVNIYTLWPGRAAIEILPVWWNADAPDTEGAGAAVYDAAAVAVQPVEIKRVSSTEFPEVPAFDVVCNATISQSAPAFEKTSLLDTSADEMYLRVVSATAPGTATHLRLVVEVTP